ncbi:C-type mannose receptor 2 [Saguinus oedipus]|uniref:C-type mannose receptor 2 n=1 Tax=Saguinus oedipus TaxID=9490 RepID=A0ABQ9VNF9_SAGOE|nr:C-type mannose receptor 2 [Saguinus oedipus]
MAPHAQGSRRYSWVSEEPLSYMGWQEGEPQHLGGCTYVDVDGAWRTTSCDTRLQGAMCGIRNGSPPPRRISYHGSCPQRLADSSWIPFREHCYSFHMELLLGHKEAQQRCQRAGGAVLSIRDEAENVFVWEYMQNYAGHNRGAWLGMNFNPKGGTLVWQDNTAVNYSNWGPPGLGPSMLSHNSCYWIQSNSGLWRPGACTNITMGVICKLPRAQQSSFSPSALPENPAALVVVLMAVLLLLALVTAALILYRRRQSSERGSFEGARYSRSSSSPAEATEKNILVSDMEMNEQQE